MRLMHVIDSGVFLWHLIFLQFTIRSSSFRCFGFIGHATPLRRNEIENTSMPEMTWSEVAKQLALISLWYFSWRIFAMKSKWNQAAAALRSRSNSESMSMISERRTSNKTFDQCDPFRWIGAFLIRHYLIWIIFLSAMRSPNRIYRLVCHCSLTRLLRYYVSFEFSFIFISNSFLSFCAQTEKHLAQRTIECIHW